MKKGKNPEGQGPVAQADPYELELKKSRKHPRSSACSPTRAQATRSVLQELDFLFLMCLKLLVLVPIILCNIKHVPKPI